MIIVHIAIANFYREGMGYQENILPIKHIELGYDVYMITCQLDEKVKEVESYTNNEGLKVYKLPKYKSLVRGVPVLNCAVKKTSGLRELLEQLLPDIIFIHGLQAVDNLEVIGYLKKHKATLFVDQHADYYNTPVKTIKQILVQRCIYRIVAHKLLPYVKQFWGVTPWRVKYLKEVYGLPDDKVNLLVMGGDEKLIDWENRMQIRKEVRQSLGIPEDAFVFITGGKLGKAKNLHILLEALNVINNKNYYIIVFGNFEDDEYQLCLPFINNNVKLLGWIGSKDVYPYYLSSDMSVFPGTHSVLWEQSCASGLPGIFKDWSGGFTHVDVGGNALFIKDVSVDSIIAAINKATEKENYQKIKEVAESDGRKTFSYVQIAKKSINK